MNLSAIDLNLLLVLDAVLAERSVARAAKRLHVTSPAISNALARLRVALGDPVVTRSGRGIVPTPRALELGPAVSRALRELETAIAGKAFDPKAAEVRLTLGIGDAGQLARLPDLAALVTASMPRAELRIVNVDTMLALGGLAGTEVDAAIGVADAAPGIHRLAIYEERTVLVVRDGHPRVGERVTKSTLSSERYVRVNVALGRENRAVVRSFARLGIRRDVAVLVQSYTAAASVVAATDLLATIPASVVEVLGSSLGLRVVSSPLRPAPLPMYLSWHSRTHADRAMIFFRDLVVRATATARRSAPTRA